MSARPFEVPLGDLRDHRGTRSIVRRGLVPEDLMADLDSRVPAGTEAVAEVEMEAFDGGVAVSGTVASRWEGECRRCLTKVGGELEAEVRELFRPGGGEDEGTYPMGEDHIDLQDLVMDNLFAALPLMPLCREDCAGLCPVCGANRNSDPCSCTVESSDPRWSALDALKAPAPAAHPGAADDPRP